MSPEEAQLVAEELLRNEHEGGGFTYKVSDVRPPLGIVAGRKAKRGFMAARPGRSGEDYGIESETLVDPDEWSIVFDAVSSQGKVVDGPIVRVNGRTGGARIMHSL